MQRTKKVVSLLLSVLMVVSCFTCLASITAFAADEDTYLVAGSEAEIFGTTWDGTNTDNTMAVNEDGTYSKSYTVTKAYSAVQLKTVKNGAEWIGDKTGNNVTFDLSGAGTFTVVYDPEENYTYVTGDIINEITEFEYDTVFAVGNGEGFWLNGVAWTPSTEANKMTEVEDDVWEISFENVPDGFERQIKFAIDGAWTHNFGGVFEESGVETAAVYNGDNITFDTDDTCKVTAKLDLREFDFATKEGAKYTITIEYDEPEATSEPTTELEGDDVCIVAGSEAEIFGTTWDGTNEDNLMTKAEDGTFTKDYTVEKAYSAVQLKTVKDGAEWIGDKTGNNVTFDLSGAGTFTVVYDPEENYTYVKGDIVKEITEFKYDAVFAVGNGEGFWLNGVAWDPAAEVNKMTETADDVWEISFENVPDGFERQIKFAIDGAWTHNFGGAFEESGVATAAAYNGDNITFDTDDTCTVKAQLDLREFDFATKEGAKFTITVDYPSDSTYIVAGSEAEIFGTTWDGGNEDNLMTKAEDGTFTKDYTVTKAYSAVQLKTVKDGAEWIGDKTGNNVTFDLTGEGTFTVVYDPEENYTYVKGDIVKEITEFKYDAVFAVGNGEGFWLNGVAWDPAAEVNKMTKVADDVWEISFENVPDGFERQIKFAIDGAWTHNFGGAFEESGVATAAAYNGDNITFDTDDTCTVKAQLDLREFDFATKEGAKFTITVDYGKEIVYGDVDGDGQVRINDATFLQRSMAEQEGYVLEPGTDAFKAGDVDGDGKITIEDVTLVQRYLAQFISVFPVETIDAPV